MSGINGSYSESHALTCTGGNLATAPDSNNWRTVSG